jgi:alanyl-tRNA synthetase
MTASFDCFPSQHVSNFKSPQAAKIRQPKERAGTLYGVPLCSPFAAAGVIGTVDRSTFRLCMLLPGFRQTQNMTSAQIRQSFLDFFKSKGHTIVPSSSLLPDSPNLLFTNAGMNQFVPIFLGQRPADVSKWANAIPNSDTRAADTQKCIRAGGKHNDLEDVGLDTYHHTFFEMLGNWSFGDYFKREAIDWAWELITEVWKFPKNRLYATVYSPGKGDPSEFDKDAHDFWAEKFRAAGLDPAVHIVNGNKKDNFWMMGDTGPCGPCSEIHVDLTPQGDTKGRLVNQGSAECIEIWNLVFIQFNAEPDGPEEASKMTTPGAKPGVDWRQRFVPLPARHVDTGMGFERVTGIIQNTKGFTDFSRMISNYETDIFRPIFDRLEKLSDKRYSSTLPAAGSTGQTEQEKIDVAFRVIADHIRTLSFSIADGIEPGNKVRNAVVRRVLRRATMFGRALSFRTPFLYKLVPILADTMGTVFPELVASQESIERVIRREEEAFNKTLDRGIEIFEEHVQTLESEYSKHFASGIAKAQSGDAMARGALPAKTISGEVAFELHATYGLPVEEVERLAREKGYLVDRSEFEHLNAEHKDVSGGGQVREVIQVSEITTGTPTKFVGYDEFETSANVLETLRVKDRTAVILDKSPLYAEMGGQVGDTGEISGNGALWQIANTQKSGNTWLHFLSAPDGGTENSSPNADASVTVRVDRPRRDAIQRHHTVTHLLHWALHEVVSKDAVQKGSYVGPEKLTFDFSSAALSPEQVSDVERLVNERILQNALVSWTEVKYGDIRDRKDVMQFFGEKYGDTVRVVQIGGKPGELNGYSMELCGGTHARGAGEIGLFRIVAESAVAAGIRRIEAVAGLEAYKQANQHLQLIRTLAGKVNSPLAELEKKIEALLAHQKELEKQLKSAQQREAAETARSLVNKAQKLGSTTAIIENLGAVDGDTLQTITDALKSSFKGVVVIGGSANGAVSLVATVSPELTKTVQAGKIIQTIAPLVGGKGGGRPDNARGGGKDASKLDAALAQARSMLS